MMSFMSQFWVDIIYDWHLRNHPIMKSTLLVNKTHMKIVERSILKDKPKVLKIGFLGKILFEKTLNQTVTLVSCNFTCWI